MTQLCIHTATGMICYENHATRRGVRYTLSSMKLGSKARRVLDRGYLPRGTSVWDKLEVLIVEARKTHSFDDFFVITRKDKAAARRRR